VRERTTSAAAGSSRCIVYDVTTDAKYCGKACTETMIVRMDSSAKTVRLARKENYQCRPEKGSCCDGPATAPPDTGATTDQAVHSFLRR